MNSRYATGLIAISAFAIVACSDAPTGGDPVDDLDSSVNLAVAMVAADATIEDVRSLKDPQNGGFIMDGRSGSRSATFYDAGGNEQDGYDPLTTAKIVYVMEMEREVEREGWSASMTRSREMVVTGLEGEETTRTVNGAGAHASSRSRHSDDGGERSYEMSGASTIDNVVHPVPRGEGSYPLSGTITRIMTVTITTPDGTRTKTREVIITFNGTQYPEMMVDGEPFEVDLAARERDVPFRKGPRHRDGPSDRPGS